MPITTKINSLQFRLTGVDGGPTRFRTRQNVKKRIADILYLRDLPQDAVKLAYVGSKELTPLVNMFIGDRSDELYANSRSATTIEFSGEATSVIPVKNLNFLVTQEFVDAEGGPVPLYYKHTLPVDIIPESIRVLDKDFNEVSKDKYKVQAIEEIDEDTGTGTGTYLEYRVYNSLEGSYNHTTGEYEVYFIQYTVGSGIRDLVYTVLLDNEPAYREAGVADYWSVTLGLKPWENVYSVSASYDLTLPTTGYFSVRYLEQKRMSVKHPVDYTDIEPWYPRVVNGGFNHGYAGLNIAYGIPEFQNQAFNPIEPYKLAANKKCFKIDDRLIKLAHEDIVFGAMFSDLKIVIKEDGATLYAITMDTEADGDVYYNNAGQREFDSNGDVITWNSALLLGVDRLTGIAQVDINILDSYEIFADYTYEENYFPVPGLVMNPIFDPDAHKEVRVVYIVPESIANANLGKQTESVKWLKVSPSGRILATNQNGSGFNEDINNSGKDVRLKMAVGDLKSEGWQLEGIIGLHYSWQASTTINTISPATVAEVYPGSVISVVSTSTFPRTGWLRFNDSYGSLNKFRYVKYVDKTDTTFTLSDQADECPQDATLLGGGDPIYIADGDTVELVNFLEERTTLSSRDLDTEVAGFELSPPNYPASFSRYFVLAEMTINSPHAVADSSIIDVRQDGGGIAEDKYEEAKALNPQVQWLNDHGNFDGQLYPGNAVAVVKLPISLLESYTLDNIKGIVDESIPVGVHPLIRFYGYEPRIISITPQEGAILVEWEKEGPEFTYDIWYATNEEGPWTRANPTRLIDGTGDNQFIIEGLDPNKIYTVRITMQDKYFMWWYGYEGHDDISGGLGLDEDPPTPPFGNIANFQFKII